MLLHINGKFTMKKIGETFLQMTLIAQNHNPINVLVQIHCAVLLVRINESDSLKVIVMKHLSDINFVLV